MPWAADHLDRAMGAVIDTLLPRRCVLCDRTSSGLCADCARLLRPPAPEAVRAAVGAAGLDALVAACDYDRTGAAMVLALKRRNRHDAVELLGTSLAEFATPLVVGTGRDVLVTWAPTTRQRRRERGFDQAEVLARAVGRAGGLPVRATLRRTGAAQMGRSGRDRRHTPSFELRADLGPTQRAPVVVLVDDVVTSGATMAAATGVLRSAGAVVVVGAALAVSA